MSLPFDNKIFSLAVRLAGAVLFVCAVASAVIYSHYQSALSQRVLESGQSKMVVIPEGATWSETVGILSRAGLVEHPTYFEIWARWSSLPREVKAGSYYFEGPLAVRELGARLRSGAAPRDVRVTIPEGWTMFHIADRFEHRGLANREEFLRTVRSEELLEEFGIDAESFEGYLFPDTYRFQEGASAEQIVRRLHRRWREVWRDVEEANAKSLRRLQESYELTRHQLVTLASIVEAEAPVRAERPKVARVILNRLDRSMRLQMDPTCIYGPDAYEKIPSPSLCKDASNRYSTYVIDGLPPGPIANPSKSSLNAAVDPSDDGKSEDYLFFVARQDGSGRHVFTSTYREHKRAVQKYLK